MSRERVERIVILGWREWGNRLKEVIYKDLEGFEKFDRSMDWPYVGEVVLKVVD